jgi:hypothetical protein
MGADNTNNIGYIQAVGSLAFKPLVLQGRGGNVGIGTTSPTYPLQIAGSDVTISGAASNVNMNRGAIFFAAPNDWNHVIYNNGATRDNLGTFDGMRWMVQNGLQIYAGNRSSVPSLTGIALSIDSSSRVGIGTTNPGYKLETSGGAIAVTGTNNYLYYAVTNSTASGCYMMFDAQTAGGSGRKYQIGSSGTGNNPGTGCFELYDATAAATRLVVNASGNVGIGTVSPGYKLHVSGDIYSSGRILINNTTATSTSAKISINGDAGVNGAIQIVSTNTADRNVDAIGCKACVDGNNIINFTNTAGAYRGSINGVNSTSVAYVTTSDARLKSNVVDMPSIIDRIKQLRPCNFVWKESGDKGDGFIAQEVFTVFPQMRNGVTGYCNVCSHTYNELYDGNLCACCDFENPVDTDGKPRYYGLDYGRFTPYLTKALQETLEIIETQSARITAVETENAQLKARLESLETRFTAAGF